MDAAALQATSPTRQRLDERLHGLHTICAAVWLIGASGPVTVVEFAGIPMALCFIVRAVIGRRLWIAPLRSPLILLLALWAAWQGVSLLWTPNVRQGLDEIGTMRWVWWLWMAYPVMDRRRTLITAYAAGFALGHVTQVIQYLAPGAVWHREPDRFSGWWEPVAGAVILTGAFGLHLPAALMGQGRERLIGAAGAIAAAFGVLLTGTRSAWLACAGLAAIVGAFTLLRLGRQALRPAAVGALVVLVGGAAAWLIAGNSIQARYDRAVAEIRTAVENRDFSTDTGARLLMNWWAIQAFAQHPIVGIGAGGYRAWVIAHLDTAGVDPTRIHDQAHSAPLHIAGTNGAVGLLITVGIAVVALRQARDRAAPSGSPPPRGIAFPGDADAHSHHLPVATPSGEIPLPRGWGSYDAGPFFALLGLLLVSLFNTIHISAQPAAHLAILFALCPPLRRSAPTMPEVPT